MQKSRTSLVIFMAIILTALCALPAFSATRYVDGNAAGTNKGTSWANAFKFVQDGISVAAIGDEVWVAQGTYNPKTVGRPVAILKDGVSVYGGFVGIETNLIERDPALNLTILDGQNLIPLVTVGATNSRLDGFTVTGANGTNLNGGGMYVYAEANFVIENCVFTDNAAKRGGGILAKFSNYSIVNCVFDGNRASEGGAVYNFESSAAISGCDFTSNNTTQDGGAIYNYNADGTVIDSCLFDANSAVQAGGVYNYYTIADITASIFDGNAAAQSGGGIYNNASDVDLVNCLFTGNTAASWGGGIQDYISTSSVTNCTFSGNVATYGGAFGDYQAPSSNITNCILWGDNASIGGKEIARRTIYPAVTYSDVQGGWAGTGNLNVDPMFVGGGDFHLQNASPCINTGTQIGAPAQDLDGAIRNLTPWGRVDMGAYEIDIYSVAIDCSNPGPNPASELTLTQCSITGYGVPQLDTVWDTCGGTVAGSGPWTYDFTPTEEQGPGDCIAAVEIAQDPSAKDSAQIDINEANVAPLDNAPLNVTVNEGTAVGFSISPTDPDLPAQILTCEQVSNTCPGGALIGCVWGGWTPSEAEGPSSCDVVTKVFDGADYSSNKTTHVVVNEANTAPLDNAPLNVTVNEGTAVGFSISPTDPDLPAQILTCEQVSNTCPGGGLIGCVWGGWTPSEAQGPMACDVVSKVFDGVDYSVNTTTHIVVNEVNVAPTWSPLPIDISILANSIYNQNNGLAADIDLPAQTLSCSKVSQTCSFTVTVSGSGSGSVNCNINFTAGASLETCLVNIQVSDSIATVTDAVTIDVSMPAPACNDGIDNDGDTYIDYPNDPGCSSQIDTSELGANACDDGNDNDGDTLIDYPDDIGCSDITDNSEYYDGTGLLPDTGQTTCYNATGTVIGCAGTGQDGEFLTNPQSYTNNGNGTVTDNITGLIWQKCSAGKNNDATCSGTALTYTWQNALNYCNALSHGGYTDWRLPEANELMMIVNHGVFNPSINTTAFPGTILSSYWSSTTYANGTSRAWGVHFGSGYVFYDVKTYIYYVRCVR